MKEWKTSDIVWKKGHAKVTKASTVGWYYANYKDMSSGPFGTLEGAIEKAMAGKKELSKTKFAKQGKYGKCCICHRDLTRDGVFLYCSNCRNLGR